VLGQQDAVGQADVAGTGDGDFHGDFGGWDKPWAFYVRRLCDSL
jgi:hypothetical protein